MDDYEFHSIGGIKSLFQCLKVKLLEYSALSMNYANARRCIEPEMVAGGNRVSRWSLASVHFVASSWDNKANFLALGGVHGRLVLGLWSFEVD